MRTLVIAPHPDDEVLRPGGTLFRRKSEGSNIAWLIITSMENNQSIMQGKVLRRQVEIEEVAKLLEFDEIYQFGYPTAKLDQIPLNELISNITEVYTKFAPSEILIPFSGDIHTDHKLVNRASISAAKWFRSPSINRILEYETLSETNFGNSNHFEPNYYVDVSRYFESKLEALRIYTSEIDDHPFPRSIDSLNSLAILRGSESGFRKAEAFHLFKEYV